MKILVIAATKAEIILLNEMPSEVDVAVTGVGVPSTIYHLLQKLTQQKYNLVIQAGIAGVFNDAYKLGSVVLVAQDTFADIGLEEATAFKSIYHTDFSDKDEFPFTDGWLINSQASDFKQHHPLVKAVTINKVSDSILQKQQLIKNFSPDIESMEGAALHYVCLQQQIPFVQLRAISNEVGERDKTKWKMNEAISNLNTSLELFLKKLKD